MYVWARLLRVAAGARRRGPFGPGSESRLAFRCYPGDIDFNLHLNNARYLMLADLGRIDIFIRSGLAAVMKSHGWAPILGGLQVAFSREIRLWEKFEIVSSLETADDTQFIGLHRFVKTGGEAAAQIITTGGLYERKNRRFVPAAEVYRTLGYDAPPLPQAADEEEAFLRSHNHLRRMARQ